MATNSLLGVNLESLNDWSTSKMFINLLKTARALGSATTPWDGKPGTIGANGYPTSDFGACLNTGDYVNMTGTYKFSCTGNCTPVGVASPIAIQNLKYDAASNTTTADVVVSGNSNMFMGFKGSNLSNVKLLRPGYTSDDAIFTDEFLKMVAPFGTLRFMDYFATNNSTISKWGDRVLPTEPNFGVKGGPYEYAIALGNATGKGVWLHVPHLADADFVAQLADLVKRLKKPEIPCYVEYSNEVWNYSFKQGTDNLNAGTAWAKTIPTLGDFLKPFQCNDANGWRWAMYAEKTWQIAETFQKAGISNLRMIFACQIGWQLGLQVGLAYIDKYHGPVKNYIYGIAGAPYFGNNQSFMDRDGINVNDFFGPYKITWDGGKTYYSGSNYLMDMAQNLTLASGTMKTFFASAKQYGIKPICYEGGLDYGQYDKSVDSKTASQFDDRMQPIVDSYLSNWFASGGQEFMYFNLCTFYNKWGYWGLANNAGNLNVPKYLAAVDVAGKNLQAGGTTPAAVTGKVYLVTAKTGAKLSEVTAGATVDMSAGDKGLIVEPSAKVGSIGMLMATAGGSEVFTQIENASPYSIRGDNVAWTPAPGNYVLTLTYYSGTNASGTVLGATTVSFTSSGAVSTVDKVVSITIMYASGRVDTIKPA